MKALRIWAAHDSPSESRAHLIPAFLCMCLLFLYSPVPQSGQVQRGAGVKEIFSFSISKDVFCLVLIYECRDPDLYYIGGSSSQLTWHRAQAERLCTLCPVLAVILPTVSYFMSKWCDRRQHGDSCLSHSFLLRTSQMLQVFRKLKLLHSNNYYTMRGQSSVPPSVTH